MNHSDEQTVLGSNSMTEDKESVEALLSLAQEKAYSAVEKAISDCELAQAISRKIEYDEGIVKSIHLLEFLYSYTSYPDNFSELLSEAINLSENIKNPELKLKSLTATGAYYDFMNKKVLSLQYFLSAKEVLTQNETINNRCVYELYVNLGNLYFRMNNYENSKDCYSSALLYTDKNEKKKNAILDGNIAMCYSNSGDNENAILYLKKSIEIVEVDNETSILISSHNNLAGIYNLKKEHQSAIEHYKKSIGYNNNINERRLIDSYYGIAKCFYDTVLYKDAEYWLKKADVLAGKHELGNHMLIEICELLSKVFEKCGDYKEAYFYCSRANDLMFQTERRAQADKIQELEKASLKQEAEIERLKNVELKEANREILASIEYARYLQTAFHVSVEKMKKVLPNSFGITQPKDIVMGDFYWAESIGSKVLVSAADCTGHGVPGAIMTIVNKNLLEDAVEKKKLTVPGEILAEINKSLITKIEQNKSAHSREIRDGMDIALCAFDFGKMELEYAGANRPLYLIRDGILYEYTPTKASIGGFSLIGQVFVNNKIKLFKNDMIYIFSDGYADQFGGEKDKKFTTKRFKELLLSVWNKSLEDQKRIITSAIETWTFGNKPQTDDILVIGIRV